jgi:gliding motility-associated-like protein
MKWWVFILLPFSLLAQETHVNCDSITPQNYQVNFDADKIYYWGISGGKIIYNSSNSITIQWPNELGTYIISAYTTRFGCEGDTSYYEVIIQDCPYFQLFMPNSFTPNGDNYNETFYVQGIDRDKIKSLVIYNRWGEKVYETFDNTPWDGKNCQIGVYSYLVRIHNQQYKGNVQLIR